MTAYSALQERAMGNGQCGIFFFFNVHSLSTWKFLSQGLSPSHSCNLCHICGNSGSFNSLLQAGNWTWASTVTHANVVWFLTHCTTVRTWEFFFFFFFFFFWSGPLTHMFYCFFKKLINEFYYIHSYTMIITTQFYSISIPTHSPSPHFPTCLLWKP